MLFSVLPFFAPMLRYMEYVQECLDELCRGSSPSCISWQLFATCQAAAVATASKLIGSGGRTPAGLGWAELGRKSLGGASKRRARTRCRPTGPQDAKSESQGPRTAPRMGKDFEPPRRLWPVGGCQSLGAGLPGKHTSRFCLAVVGLAGRPAAAAVLFLDGSTRTQPSCSQTSAGGRRPSQTV